MSLGLRSEFTSKANIAAICVALAFVGAIVMGISRICGPAERTNRR